MKRTLRSISLFLLLLTALDATAQQLYSATTETGSRMNPGLNVQGNQKVAFDDINIPSTTVGGRDSLTVTNVKVGIRRLTGAAATTVSLYYSTVDDTATQYSTLLAIPPVLVGTVSLPANTGANYTHVVSFGDSVNQLFRVAVDTGNVYTTFFTFFLGVSLSDSTTSQGIRIATGGPNDNVIWIYNADSTVKRFATSLGSGTPAQFYMQVFGYSSGPFPVEISSFNGMAEGSRNILEWTTASEINNRGFEIQRSVDGRAFSTIGQVGSKGENGNSSLVLQYRFADEKPLAGTNYYRLKQVDRDGKMSYSGIVTIRAAAEVFSILSAYPNPARESLKLVVSSASEERATVSIADPGGKVVRQLQTGLQKGENNITLDVSPLAPGTYTLRIVNSKGETTSTRFIRN